jgi:raffinose/stachyose/melibiose transport system substrate-binding protein
MRLSLATVGALSIAAALLPACAGDDDGRVELEFFQFKPEAVETFNGLIADFEAEHPNIDVVQNHVPNADTAFRTRLVRNDIPDVITLNAGATWAEMAPAGVFYDFSGHPILGDVNPAILDILNALGTAGEGEVNGIPFASNADGVIYNKDLFAEHDVEVPTTWDELVGAAETFQAAGVTPFYGTLLDSWTSLPAWNALASNLAPEGFFDQLGAEETSFEEAYPEVAERLYQLFEFTQEDRFSRNYNDGNQAFARGESAMYLQGIWAIPTIRSFEPDFEIGTFALPTDRPDETKLVSGVDVVITMGREPAHPEESLAFIEFLMRPDVLERYAAEQSAVPTLVGTTPSDEAVTDLIPFIEEQRLVGFSDHKIPPAIPLPAINQQFLIDGDQEEYLETLDDEWDKVAERRPERLR